MKYILFLSLMPALSCGRPTCHNRNTVFEQYAPGSKEYQRELIKQLNDVGYDHMRFWIDSYVEKNQTAYMRIFVQGQNVCAAGFLDVTNDKNLENFKTSKGRGYSGAELRGLKFRIDSSNGEYRFIYEDVQAILD